MTLRITFIALGGDCLTRDYLITPETAADPARRAGAIGTAALDGEAHGWRLVHWRILEAH